MKNWARRLVLYLAVGAILFVFSERMFWSVWRPEDEVAAYAGGWLLYSFLGYVLLAQCRYFRVDDLAMLFLAAACFGWLDEGVVAMTLFGDASLPFPITISWTGLAWHALLSVMLGFYALRRCLQAPKMWPTLALSAGLGAFWGGWALGWQAETPPIRADAAAFVAHVAAATCALALAHLAIGPAGLAAVRPSKIGMWLATGIVLIFTVTVTIPTIGSVALVLLPLLGGVLLALHRRRGRPGAGNDVLRMLGGPIRPSNLMGLTGIPAAATGVYLTVDGRLLGSVHLAVAAVSTVLGFAALALALAAVLGGRPALAKRGLG